MKTVREYLQERKDMANHNLFCFSATYGMDRPKEGKEEQFTEAVRDCEIVDELIAMVEAREKSGEQTAPEVSEGLCVGQLYEARSHEVQVDVCTKVVSFRRVSGEPICDLIWKRENEYDSYQNTSIIYYHPTLPTPASDCTCLGKI